MKTEEPTEEVALETEPVPVPEEPATRPEAPCTALADLKDD